MSDSTSSSDFETSSSLLRKRKRRDVSPSTRRVQRRRIDDSSTSEGQLSYNDINRYDSSSDEESIAGFQNRNEQLNLRRALEKSEDKSKRKKFNLSLKRKNTNNSAGEPSTSSARVDQLQRSPNRPMFRFRTRMSAKQINPCVCTSCTRYNN